MFNFFKRFVRPAAEPVKTDPRETELAALRAKVEMVLHENQVLVNMCRDLTRMPLTAQQIIDLMPTQHWVGNTHQQDYMNFARAIEKAHHIGSLK